MASANLELVQSIYADCERGDWSSVEWADPEIEFVLADGASDGTWSGIAGMSEGWRQFLSAWEDLRAFPDTYHELGPDRVAVIMHNAGRGKRSGVEVGEMWQRSVNVFEIRNGKVTKLTAHLDGDRLIAELGLTPAEGSGGEDPS